MSIKLSKVLATKFLSEKEFDSLVKCQRSKAGKLDSVSNLLLTNDSNLLIICEHEKINFKKLVELREFYRKVYLNNGRTIENTINSHHPVFIRSHFPRLNELFCDVSADHGQSIIEVNGPSCSGKTQFVFEIALESLLKSQQKILYIDIDLSFPNQRFDRILKDKCVPKESFKMSRVFTIEDLLNLLESIKSDPSLHYSLLIIDSLSSIIFTIPILQDKQSFAKNKSRVLAELTLALKSVTYYANLKTIYTILSTEDCKLNLHKQITPRLTLKLERIGSTRKVVILNNLFHVESQEEIILGNSFS